VVNINIAVSDDLLKRLRIAAAEQDLSQKEEKETRNMIIS
jgi:hypothetical protein